MNKEIKELKELTLSALNMAASEGEEKCYKLFSEKLNELIRIRTTLNPTQDKKMMNEFRKELLPFFHQSFFCKYVFDKPRGYPGDYKTQEMIWYGITNGGSNEFIKETELGRLITSFTYRMENPKANVARILFLKKKILEGGKRFASLGCGSCIELWNLKEEEQKDKCFFLLDQDDGALKKSIERNSIKSENAIYVKENVLKFIIKNKKSYLLGNRDLIYLFGLLDYFPVNSSKKIIASLWESVAPGGKIIITNSHPDNPTKLWMEYVGDWFLDYKDKNELYTIADGLNCIDNIEYTMDDYGVYQYLEIIKKG